MMVSGFHLFKKILLVLLVVSLTACDNTAPEEGGEGSEGGGGSNGGSGSEGGGGSNGGSGSGGGGGSVPADVYTKSEVDALDKQLKTYTDEKAEETLLFAEILAESALIAANAHSDSNDASTLAAANEFSKNYTDTKTASLLQAANDYTDTALLEKRDIVDSYNRAETRQISYAAMVGAFADYNLLVEPGIYAVSGGVNKPPSVSNNLFVEVFRTGGESWAANPAVTQRAFNNDGAVGELWIRHTQDGGIVWTTWTNMSPSGDYALRDEVYLKIETYSDTEINAMIDALKTVDASLQTQIDSIVVASGNYYKKTETYSDTEINAVVDVLNLKDNFLQAEINRLRNTMTDSDSDLQAQIDSIQAQIDSINASLLTAKGEYYTKTEIDDLLSNYATDTVAESEVSPLAWQAKNDFINGDWNTFTNPGVYLVSNDLSVANRPPTTTTTLFVEVVKVNPEFGHYYASQKVYNASDTGMIEIYQRHTTSADGSFWSNWSRIDSNGPRVSGVFAFGAHSDTANPPGTIVAPNTNCKDMTLSDFTPDLETLGVIYAVVAEANSATYPPTGQYPVMHVIARQLTNRSIKFCLVRVDQNNLSNAIYNISWEQR